jgi:hypothetical protein
MIEFSHRKESGAHNPLRTHNLFVGGAAALLAIAAIVVLVGVRGQLGGGGRLPSVVSIGVALALLAAAGNYLRAVLSQLHIHYGADWPQPLAESPQRISELLRQQSLDHPEPHGPVSGLLYSLVPALLFAPMPLRLGAEWQFRGVVSLVCLLLGLTLIMILGVPGSAGSGQGVLDWVGLLFLAMVLMTLVMPMASDPTNAAADSLLNVGWLSRLVVFSLIIPVLMVVLVPNVPRIDAFSPFPHVFVVIVLALAVQVLYFAAIVTHLPSPPDDAVTAIQDTWSFSCNPVQICEEFSRAMSEATPQGGGTRVYLRNDAKVALPAAAGSFRGESLVETAPQVSTIGSGDDVPRHPSGGRPAMLVIDGLGLALAAGMAVAGVVLGQDLAAGAVPTQAVIYFVVCWALGIYAFRSVRLLWERFDFRSRLIGFEIVGHYSAVQVGQGNAVHGNIHAQSQMVQVDSMTFRLWVAELHSVAFGKDAPRLMVALAGEPAVAQSLHERLKLFTLKHAALPNLANERNKIVFAGNMTLDKGDVVDPDPLLLESVGGFRLRGRSADGQSIDVSLSLSSLDAGIILGRSPECHVTIPGENVSRQHARLFRKSNTIYLQDLESINGTFLSGHRLPAQKPVALRGGEPIVLADARLSLIRG